MGEDSANTRHAAAQAMLDTFASVGATRFDVTWTTRAGDKEWFRRGVQPGRPPRTLPAMLDAAPPPAAQRDRAPARPRRHLHPARRPHRRPAAPASPPPCFSSSKPRREIFRHGWRVAGREDKDFARRLRKGTGADATASGATRVAGSLNFKDKYAPDFPRVAIREAHAGRMTNAAELERARPGRAAGRRAQPLPPAPARVSPGGNRKWPSYARCVDGAPLNSEETGPDRSRADFVWCMTAITWGWSVDETAERLMEESSKAQDERQGLCRTDRPQCRPRRRAPPAAAAPDRRTQPPVT